MLNQKKYYYLLELQFLGFRYHGWQKQPEVKTVQYMLDRTLITVLEHDRFKTLAASRTDSMVSANQHLCEIISDQKIKDLDQFLNLLNTNLPQDLRIISVKEVDDKFKVITDAKMKEYLYFFCHGKKAHPFSAPFMFNVKDHLDIDLMKRGAKIFEGKHHFKQYCFRPNENKTFEREILKCEISRNHYFQGEFFPKESFVMTIQGPGFLRHQVRMMAGALINLGLHKITFEELADSLKVEATKQVGFVAPASGLILNKTQMN